MPDLLVGAMICAVALGLGFLAGSAYRASELRKTGEALEELKVKNRDLSRWLQEYKDVHARGSEIAALIPSMVRRLGTASDRRPSTGGGAPHAGTLQDGAGGACGREEGRFAPGDGGSRDSSRLEGDPE